MTLICLHKHLLLEQEVLLVSQLQRKEPSVLTQVAVGWHVDVPARHSSKSKKEKYFRRQFYDLLSVNWIIQCQWNLAKKYL